MAVASLGIAALYVVVALLLQFGDRWLSIRSSGGVGTPADREKSDRPVGP